MTQPPSLKTTPFASFGNQSFGTVFATDYVHKKFGNFNIKAPTVKSGNFGLKLGLTLDDKPGSTKLISLSDEVKIGFPFTVKDNKEYLEARLRRNGELKLHLDLGDLKLSKFNFFSNLKTNMSLDNFNYRVGANYLGDKCESGTRLEMNDGNYNLTQRNIIKNGYFVLTTIAGVRLNDLKLTKYDALLKYTHNQFEIYVQHLTPKIDKTTVGLHPGKLAFNAVLNHSEKDTFGFHYKYDTTRSKGRVVVGVLHKINPDWLLRAKIDQKLKLSLSSKKKINDKISLVVGSQLNFQKGAKAIDFSKTIPVPLGISVDLNI